MLSRSRGAEVKLPPGAGADITLRYTASAPGLRMLTSYNFIKGLNIYAEKSHVR
jgi:hypothetical protein